MPALPPGYAITRTTPSVETYISLRTSTGLTPFSTEAAARGLPNSLFTVQIMHEGQAVGSKSFRSLAHSTRSLHAPFFQRLSLRPLRSALNDGGDFPLKPSWWLVL